MLYEEFFQKLKRARKAKSVTVEELANVLQVAPSHINRIESGKTEIRISEFLRWCKYLEISPRGFFDNLHPFKSLRYKKTCEMIEDLDGEDFEMMRRIVNAVHRTKNKNTVK